MRLNAFKADLDDRPGNPYLAPVVSVLLIGVFLVVWQVMMAGDGGEPVGDDAAGSGVTTVRQGRTENDVPPSAASVRRQGALATSDGAVRTDVTRQAVTVYIVATPEAAKRVGWGLDEGNAVRAAMGEPPLNEAVVVAGTAEETRLLRLLDDAAALHEALHLPLPAITEVDLHMP